MRRCLIGLVVLAALTACSDSSPTTTTAPALNHRIRSVVVTGTLDENINELFDLFPPKLAQELRGHWNQIKTEYAAGQTNPKTLVSAKKHLNDLILKILAKTNQMNQPPDDESKQSAASRLILYMLLYVYGDQGPDTPAPPYFPGADNAVGRLPAGGSLTLVTPSGNAGLQFGKGSSDTDRIIVIVQNPAPYGPCDGPLTTNLCQYPLFYDFMSFPDDAPLLLMGKAAICHPKEDTDRGPTGGVEGNHQWLRLAHKKPASEDDYVDGGIVPTDEGEDIEILPLITQTFVTCEDNDSQYYPPPGDFYEDVGALNRGLRSVVRLASRVGKFLLPKSAYAIDQGGGGGFMIFSPFNNVDASPYLNPPD